MPTPILVGAVDYFTKWVEAKILAQVKTSNIEKFILKSIMCRFGMPRIIVTDNGPQFKYGPQFNYKAFKFFAKSRGST